MSDRVYHNGQRHAIALLPPGELNDETELVFVDGRAFVNAEKHELVVAALLEHMEQQHRIVRVCLVCVFVTVVFATLSLTL